MKSQNWIVPRGLSLLTLLLAWLPATISHAQTPTPATPPKPRTQVVLLGTGNPSADPDRMGPSVAIVVNDVPYIVDCGPGIVRWANAAARKGITGLAVPKLKTAFLTHLHSDHTIGYPDPI